MPGESRCSAFSRHLGEGCAGREIARQFRGVLPCAGWCHPLRRSGIHGDPRSFRLRSEGKGELVRAEGLEPSRALRPNGFSYPSTAFAAPAVLQQGLGSGLSLHRVPDGHPVVRCCPSSLYTFPTGKLIAPAGLGSGSPCYRVPRIWAVLHRRFPGEHSSFRLSPMRLPIPPRPRGRFAPWPQGRPQPRERPYVDSTPPVRREVRSFLASSALC